MIRIRKLSKYNLRPLEDELDRIGWKKYDIEPWPRTVPSLDPFEDRLGFDFEEDEDEY